MPVTEVFDDAGAFVSHDAPGFGQRIVLLGLVAAPGVQVGSANAGLGHAKQHGSGFGFRNVVLFDLKGFAVFLDDNDASFHVGPSVLTVSALTVADGRYPSIRSMDR